MAQETQIENYLQKAKLIELLTRYFRAVDDKGLDLTVMEATFTAGARIIRPNGSALTGHRDILNGQTRSFARFKATHHVITDYVIDFDGNEATLKANLTAMHLWADNDDNPKLNNTHFLAGGVLTLKAAAMDNEWRFYELSNRNVWRSGDGMSEMANFERPQK